ncbi:hypothetical protein KK083_12770 [Fulvivirgaceae bacterium PWU4]|uniref:Sensor of ECF-type sigma factor n=1 Tax=Chryseosolibacter histidini TaxID=2782349 RepID=A0AAP2DMB7_9BACT|nr:hypothetical protein [Chryseosolibacter histidini]MBT1697757.1 hypothetical protein [Chryseosolibacter histidini]
MKTLKILLLLLCVVPAFAQEDEAMEIDRDPKAQQKIKAAHAAYITECLGLTPDEAEKFWPVYREYAGKRQELRQQFRDARKNGQDEKALLDLDLKIKQQELDLEKDYSGRFQKIITPQKLMNLRQAEGDFRRLILRQIQQRQQQIEKRHQMRDRSNQRLQQRNN